MSNTVLVVDDDRALRAMMARSLEQAGFSVVQAEDGEAGLARFEAQPFAAVVTDLRMPGLDGAELMERIRRLDAEVPIVLVTGDPDLESARAAVVSNASDYIVKPFKPEELLARIQRATQLVELRRRNERQQRELERRHAQLLARDRRRAELFGTFIGQAAEPLSVIKRQVELLLSGAGGALDSAQVAALSRITEAADGLWRSTQDLFDLRLLEEYETRAQEQTFELRELLDEAVQASGGAVEVAAPEQRASGDRVVLLKILGSLLSGLLEVGSGQVRLEAVPRGPDRLEVTLEDHGSQVGQEAWEAACSGATGAAERHGFGAAATIALPLARRLAEAIGGELSVGAIAGVDTRISVTLPIRLL